MKYIFVIFVLILPLFAGKMQTPVDKYIASSSVTDMVVQKNRLYVATDGSCIDIFNLKSKKLVQKITIEKIEDFMGDIIDAKIFSVDIINNKILILSQGMQGYRRVYIYENDALSLLIQESDSLSIAKAKFIDKNTIFLALLSDEIISYDMKKHHKNYRVSASASKFSDFALSDDKRKVAVVDESGDMQLLRTKDGSHIHSYSGENLDNVFGVDYKSHFIATAGQDRRIVIYNTQTNAAYYKSSSFFIYCVGFSPSGKLAAYSSDVKNNITLFNTSTKINIAQYKGTKSTLSKILFLDEKTFLVSSNSRTINLYKVR